MSDPVFKYTDASQRAVDRLWPDGRFESHLVDAEVVKRWIAQGNTPLPADPAPSADTAAAMLDRQRQEALGDLGTMIDSLPAAQQAPLKLIQKLLQEK